VLSSLVLRLNLSSVHFDLPIKKFSVLFCSCGAGTDSPFLHFSCDLVVGTLVLAGFPRFRTRPLPLGLISSPVFFIQDISEPPLFMEGFVLGVWGWGWGLGCGLCAPKLMVPLRFLCNYPEFTYPPCFFNTRFPISSESQSMSP